MSQNLPQISSASVLIDFETCAYEQMQYGFAVIYWVTQKLPKIYTANHATFLIQIRKITVQICGNLWVPQYSNTAITFPLFDVHFISYLKRFSSITLNVHRMPEHKTVPWKTHVKSVNCPFKYTLHGQKFPS